MSPQSRDSLTRELEKALSIVADGIQDETVIPPRYVKQVLEYFADVSRFSESGDYGDAAELIELCRQLLDNAKIDDEQLNYSFKFDQLRNAFETVHTILGTLLAQDSNSEPDNEPIKTKYKPNDHRLSVGEQEFVDAFYELRRTLLSGTLVSGTRRKKVEQYCELVDFIVNTAKPFEIMPAVLLGFHRAFKRESTLPRGQGLQADPAYRDAERQMTQLQRLADELLRGRYRVDYTFPEDEPDDS